MAQDIFGTHDWEFYGSEVAAYDDSETVDVDGEHWYQTELPLKNVRELERELEQQIRKWDASYKRMMIYALKWHYLVEECDENPQVKKMFLDMQMVRKLGGSDRV